MSKKINAAVIEKLNGDFDIKEVYVDDEPKANEVLVNIVATGICHTDEALRNGQSGVTEFPRIAGHEGAGIVEKVGAGVTNIKPGDHVILSYAFDGTCEQCLKGHPSSCLNWGELNVGGKRPDGAPTFTAEDGSVIDNFFNQSSFASTTLVQQNNVIVIDKKVDLRKVGPLGCGLVTGSGTVFNGLNPQQGSTIVIVGSGAVGAGAIMAAKIKGCSKIISVDIHDQRLETSKKIGATDTINSKDLNWVEEVKKLTDGYGVDFAIDTTGISKIIKECLDVLKSGGHFAPIAVTDKSLEFLPWNELVASQKHVDGILMGDAVPQLLIPQLIEFWQKGQFPFDILEKIYDFSEINEANKASNKGSVIKPVLIVDKSYQA
ncbi:NAD(P)-dependent alcohol dehydrogenase [Lactobacillus terrae]|uniref:NAD(P)-dependent alcohol dehydrogenase n=1 Tax=Lactobacillus terrae TaxID=2269374 RepID=UPI000C1B611D|nr:NAD(P)-dependent alcohol dehydrogenase [Lactobacillus terrae]